MLAYKHSYSAWDLDVLNYCGSDDSINGHFLQLVKLILVNYFKLNYTMKL